MQGMATVLLACALCASGCYDTVSVDLFPDAGFDAGMDGGMDAGMDGGTDGGTDAGMDASTDADIPDADIPDADVPDADVPIMGCMDLCDTVLDWSSAQLSCIAQVLRIAGYAPGANPACRLVRDPQECVDCAGEMGLNDNVCIGLAFICLP
jgi:hypothetical protein